MWGLQNETHLFSLIPLLTHLSSAGQRGSEKAGTDWTCRKLTPPCEPTATSKWAQHSWCRDPGEQTRERTGFIPAFVAGRGTSSRSGLSSNTWEWAVRGDTCVDKPRDFIEKGGLGGEQRGKRTQEDSSALSQVFGDALSFQVVPGQSFWLRAPAGGVHSAQPRWMPERILGGGRTPGTWWSDTSFWPFPNSSSWNSSMFLTRTSCYKITCKSMAPGQCWGFWSMLPLTLWVLESPPWNICARTANQGLPWWSSGWNFAFRSRGCRFIPWGEGVGSHKASN